MAIARDADLDIVRVGLDGSGNGTTLVEVVRDRRLRKFVEGYYADRASVSSSSSRWWGLSAGAASPDRPRQAGEQRADAASPRGPPRSGRRPRRRPVRAVPHAPGDVEVGPSRAGGSQPQHRQHRRAVHRHADLQRRRDDAAGQGLAGPDQLEPTTVTLQPSRWSRACGTRTSERRPLRSSGTAYATHRSATVPRADVDLPGVRSRITSVPHRRRVAGPGSDVCAAGPAVRVVRSSEESRGHPRQHRRYVRRHRARRLRSSAGWWRPPSRLSFALVLVGSRSFTSSAGLASARRRPSARCARRGSSRLPRARPPSGGRGARGWTAARRPHAHVFRIASAVTLGRPVARNRRTRTSPRATAAGGARATSGPSAR